MEEPAKYVHESAKYVHESAKYGHESAKYVLFDQVNPRQELVDDIFHAFVNLIIELLALTLAFVFFLTQQSSKAVWNILEKSTYDDQRRRLSELVSAKLDAACEISQDCCVVDKESGKSPIDMSTDASIFALNLLRDSDPSQNATSVQNTWVMRTAVIYSVFAGIILFVLFVALKLGGGKIKTNLGNIFIYNLVLLVVTFAVQIAFMYFVTLRYIPSDESRRNQLLLSNLDLVFDRARETMDTKTERPTGLLTNDKVLERIAPKETLIPNLVLVGIFVVIVLIVFGAWKTRAFQSVTFVQSIIIQALFISYTMTGMYFILKDRVIGKVEETMIQDFAQGIADKAVKLPDRGLGVQQEIRNVLATQGEGTLKADAKVKETNAAIVNKLVIALVAGSIFCLLVLVFVTRRQRQRFGAKKFLLMLAIVGLVGASTSALVEWGFGINIVSNYKPLNTGQFINYWIENVSKSMKTHSRIFCDAKRRGARKVIVPWLPISPLSME